MNKIEKMKLQAEMDRSAQKKKKEKDKIFVRFEMPPGCETDEQRMVRRGKMGMVKVITTKGID